MGLEYIASVSRPARSYQRSVIHRHVEPMTTKVLDAEYLAAALGRAGRRFDHAEPLTIEPLLGGRTGAGVARLRSKDASYVVKTVPSVSWRGAGTGCPEGGEPRLWLSDIAARLPPSVRWPVLDVSLDSSDCYRMLMEDVSDGIRGRGRFTMADSGELVRAIAAMHAHCFGADWLQRAPIPSVAGTTRVLTEPILHAAGARTSSEPWVAEVLRDFSVLGAFLPGFLDLLGPQMADAWLALASDDYWQTKLRESRATLLHGDLRRANIAFESGRVALLDWEFAAAGPPACDLQWHVFLHYWAYPPEGTSPGDACDDLRELHARAFEEASGRRIDRAELLQDWALGWIRAMIILGYVLYDPLHPNGGTPEARAQIRELATRGVQRAIDARAALG